MAQYVLCGGGLFGVSQYNIDGYFNNFAKIKAHELIHALFYIQAV